MATKNINKLLRELFEVSLETASPSLMTKAEELRQANSRLEEIFAEGKTEIRILIVADGDVTFRDKDFGLTELIDNALLHDRMPWEEITVVRAYRLGKDSGNSIPDFRFDKIPDPPHDQPLSSYDQIWLFGHVGEKGALSEAEIRELAKFMNNGGGVFATGDHEDLGAGLCGKVPRVQNMRKWLSVDSPPPRNTIFRVDSLREGHEPGFDVSDQSDDVPQEIRPVLRMKGTTSSEPHELLSRSPFAITVFPDHMHEGECRIPSILTDVIRLDDKTEFKEYPPERGKGEDERLAPVVVAISTSASGFVTGDSQGPFKPVIPRCYNVIVAYNGHQASRASDKSEREGVGRVVVDSSFHHFVNINLKGFKGGSEHGPAIKQYHRNIDLWLRPPQKQVSYYMNMLLAARYVSPLIEEVRAGDQITQDSVMFVGTATHQAIADRFSSVDATRCAVVAAGMISEDFKLDLESLIDPWAVSSTQADLSYLLFNTDILVKFLLGSAMLGIARNLPESSNKVSSELAKGEEREKQLRGFIAGGVREAAKLLPPIATRSIAVLNEFTTTLNTSL